MCIRDSFFYAQNHGQIQEIGGVSFEQACLYRRQAERLSLLLLLDESVSYTHLDVYKRQEHGLTQEQLAEQLGVAANTIARIETGNRNVFDDCVFSFQGSSSRFSLAVSKLYLFLMQVFIEMCIRDRD